MQNLTLRSLAVIVLATTGVSAALAQTNKPLEQRVAELEAQVSVLLKDVTAANARLYTLEGKTKFMSVSGNETRFTGTNVVVRKDSGQNGVPNGLGNLIVGYNSLRSDGKPTIRTGSHNIVFGNENSYAGLSSLVGGLRNDVKAGYSAILSGEGNIVSAKSGKSNDYYPVFGVILTGQEGRVGNTFGLVGSGYHNVVDGDYGFIATGYDNKVFRLDGTSSWSAIMSGQQNQTMSQFNVLLSGVGNKTTKVGASFGSGLYQTQGSHWWFANGGY